MESRYIALTLQAFETEFKKKPSEVPGVQQHAVKDEEGNPVNTVFLKDPRSPFPTYVVYSEAQTVQREK
eukprot:9793336-Lingulodinium_polyedra.AAC.1